MMEFKAGRLDYAHLGKVVQLHWTFPKSKVQARVRGELVAITHTESGTLLHLVGGGGDDEAPESFSLKSSEAVEVIQQ